MYSKYLISYSSYATGPSGEDSGFDSQRSGEKTAKLCYFEG
jgi:hypothetical protein